MQSATVQATPPLVLPSIQVDNTISNLVSLLQSVTAAAVPTVKPAAVATIQVPTIVPGLPTSSITAQPASIQVPTVVPGLPTSSITAQPTPIQVPIIVPTTSITAQPTIPQKQQSRAILTKMVEQCDDNITDKQNAKLISAELDSATHSKQNCNVIHTDSVTNAKTIQTSPL